MLTVIRFVTSVVGAAVLLYLESAPRVPGFKPGAGSVFWADIGRM